jgi:hypothetical protein
VGKGEPGFGGCRCGHGVRHIATADELRDWELNGAEWRAVEISDARAVVELCTCYGERVDVVVTEEPEVIEFVRASRDN